MAGSGYKIAEAYADFTFDTDKAIDEAVARLRASGNKFDRAGRDAGEGYSKGFKGGLDLNKHLDTEVEKLKAKGNQITRTGQTAGEGYARGFKGGANLRPAVVEQVAVLKSAKPAFQNEGKQAGQAYAKGFGNTKLSAGNVSAGGLGGAGEQAGDDLGRGVARGYKKATPEVDKETEKVAARTQATFKALVFAGAFAGLPAAAAVGALGVGAVLAGVPALFLGLGVAAISGTETVQNAFTHLADNVQDSTKDMARGLTGPVAQAAGDLGDSFDRMKPQIQEAMTDSAGAVKTLTGTVTDFAENAMPGMVVAVKNSEAPLKGLRSFAGQTGAGLTDFFTNLSSGAQSSGENLGTLGSITRGLEGSLGTWLANLSNGGTKILPQFGGALNQVEGIVTSVTSNGMPALTGATSGFLGTVGGGLNIVQGFSSALGSWTAPLGSAAGSLFATNSVAKLFGTSLGETGFGLKAFATSIDAAGQKTSPFKQALATADSEGNSKFKAGAKAIVSNGLDPLGLALIAGGFLLDAWGKDTQKAAADAADYTKGVSEIRNTLSSGSGAVTQATREYAAQNLITKELGDTHKTGAKLAQEYGLSTEVSTQAATGNTSALHQVDTQLRSNVGNMLKANLSQEEANALQTAGVSTQDQITLALGGSAAGYKDLDTAVSAFAGTTDDSLGTLGSAFQTIQTSTAGQRAFWTEVVRSNSEVTEAQRQMRTLGEATSYTGDTLKLSAGAAGVLSSALQQVGSDAASAADSGQALLTALNLLSGGTVSLSDAQAKSQKAFADTDKYLKGLADGGKAAKGSLAELVNGDGGINGLTSKGAALNTVFTELNSSMGTQASAAFTASQAAGDNLTQSMAKVNAVVASSRDKFIGAAQAAGLTKTQAAGLADQMGLIPELVDIQFVAKGDSQLEDKLISITHLVNSNNDKTIIVKSDSIAGAEDQIRSLGYKLSAMPNGEVRITAPNAPKVDQDVTDIIDKVNTIPAGKTVTLKTITKEAEAQLTTLGFTVTHLPDGSITVDAVTKPAVDSAQGAVGDINKLGANVSVDAVTAPAEAGVADWQRATSKVVGNTTTYTQVDPATGQVQEWKRTTDATGARTTTYSSTDPATGSVRSWKQYADGTWGQVNVSANAAAANAAIDNAARNRTSVITVVQHLNTVVGNIVASALSRAQGGPLTGHATGGAMTPRARPVPMLAGGAQATDIRSGGMLTGAGSSRSDSLLLLGSRDEFMIKGSEAQRHPSELAQINNGTYPWPSKTAKSAPAASTVINNYNTFQLPETDVSALATLVSREIDRRGR